MKILPKIKFPAMEQANALRNLSSQLLSFSSSSNSRVPGQVPQIGHADMSSGTRSTKRSPVFCGYVPTNAKATVNHMIDSNGARADLDWILNETRYGTAFYHSDSQPQQDVEVEDGKAGDSDQHTSSSPYVQVRSRSIISTEVRDQLLADRGEFRKALRKYLGKYLDVRPVGLATW